MRIRNVVGLVLVLVSFVLLYPGLTRDLVTLTASFSLLGNTIDLFEETRSILGSIRTLHDSGNDFVAGLILFFSVLVPFLKGALLVAAMLWKGERGRYRIYTFVRDISKWAMADVFAVGVYVAFLAARATDNMDAQLKPGFYWFVGYCLVSLLALQFIKIDDPDHIPAAAPASR